MFKYLILVALVPAIMAEWYRECPDYPGAMPSNLSSDKCDGERCYLDSNVNIDFTMDFVAPNAITYFNPSGKLIFYGPDGTPAEEPIDFPADISDGCANLVGSSCPLASGSTNTWAIDWDWYKSFAFGDLDYDVEVRHYDQDEQMFSCFQFTVQYTHNN